MTSDPALTSQLAEFRPRMERFAQELVMIPTENPPGERLRECAERIASELDLLKLEPSIVEIPVDGPGDRRYWVRGSTPGNGRMLYFQGHYDVVPASTVGQFEGVIEDKRLRGRGSADMKSGIALMTYAAAAIAACCPTLNGRVGLSFVPDEETGGARGSNYLAQAGLLGTDGMGMLTAEPTGGVVWNANRGAVSMRIVVRGRSAHVGLAHAGVNAFESMLKVASALLDLKNEVGERRTHHAVQPAAADRSILLLGGELHGGSNFNVVPDTASFTIDRRTNPEEDLTAERDRIEEIVDGFRSEGIAIDVETFQYGEASTSSADDPLARNLSDAITEVVGQRPRFEMCPGLLEIRFYAGLGQPAYAYGPGSLEVAHQANEFVNLDELNRTALVYALTASRHLSDR